MNRLTNEQIEKLASRKGVDRTAVENFLMTVDANDNATSAYANARDDGKSYKWNAATQTAISLGITWACNAKKETT